MIARLAAILALTLVALVATAFRGQAPNRVVDRYDHISTGFVLDGRHAEVACDSCHVGARFKGSNKRGLARWSTTNEVEEATPGEAFAFKTLQSGYRWIYRFEPDGDGTVVTERREPFRDRPRLAKVFTQLLLGGEDGHTDELRAGMQQTLERLKAIAEST